MSETPEPLDDHEQAYLYEVCRFHSARAYGLVRRLVRWGIFPDPPYPDAPCKPTFKPGAEQ